MKIRTIILWIFLLVILDQGVKLVIDNWFFSTHFTIIPSLLEFHPKFNYNHSYLNDLFQLGISKWIHLIFFTLIALIYIPLYAAMRISSHKKKLIDWAAIFVFAGIICAILGQVFWEGVLDFIYLIPLFIFDFKDIYMNVFVAFIILAFLKYPRLLTEKRIATYLKWQKRKCRKKL